MENQAVFSALEAVCKDAIAALSGPTGISDTEAASRLLESVRHIQGHGRALQHVVKCFTTVFHHFDLDPQTPANGYRTLVKVLWKHACLWVILPCVCVCMMYCLAFLVFYMNKTKQYMISVHTLNLWCQNVSEMIPAKFGGDSTMLHFWISVSFCCCVFERICFLKAVVQKSFMSGSILTMSEKMRPHLPTPRCKEWDPHIASLSLGVKHFKYNFINQLQFSLYLI